MIRGRWQAAATVALGAAMVVAPAAFAAPAGNSWQMDLGNGVVQDVNGTQPMTFSGQGITSVTGLVGGAVEFTRAPSLGTVAHSQNDNPGTGNFAMGAVFTSQPIPSRKTAGT